MTIKDPIDILDDTCDTLLANKPKFCLGNPGESFVFERYYSNHKDPKGQMDTIELSLAKSNKTNLMAHFVWKSSILLANMIDCAYINVSGKRVVELGAGMGLPGFISALNGSKVTHITDYPDPCIIENLECNLVELKSRYKDLMSPVFVYGYLWGSDSLIGGCGDTGEDGKFDVILLADTFWLADSHSDLLKSIKLLLAPRGKVFLTCCNHAMNDLSAELESSCDEPRVIINRYDQLEKDPNLTATTRAFLGEVLKISEWRLIKSSTPPQIPSANIAFYIIENFT